jgi:hypothetical protein
MRLCMGSLIETKAEPDGPRCTSKVSRVRSHEPRLLYARILGIGTAGRRRIADIQRIAGSSIHVGDTPPKMVGSHCQELDTASSVPSTSPNGGFASGPVRHAVVDRLRIDNRMADSGSERCSTLTPLTGQTAESPRSEFQRACKVGRHERNPRSSQHRTLVPTQNHCRR